MSLMLTLMGFRKKYLSTTNSVKLKAKTEVTTDLGEKSVKNKNINSDTEEDLKNPLVILLLDEQNNKQNNSNFNNNNQDCNYTL